MKPKDIQAIRLTPLDIAIAAIVAAGIGYVAYRAATGLNYHWRWDMVWHYLLRYDETAGAWQPGLLTEGLITTLRLSLWAGVLATVVGMAVGLMRTSPRLFNRQLSTTYVGLIRNTPPLVLIFVFYFFIGDQIMLWLGVDDFVRALSDEARSNLAWFFGRMDRFPRFLSAVVTLALFEGAYIAEIVRAGIRSVERGQWEAATALGMSRTRAMRHIIMPQALQRMLPALAGQFISIIKDSAIVSVISIEELTFQGQQIMTTTYRGFEIWTTVLAMYFVLTFACSLAVRKLEVALSRQ
ncbi:MAG: amino acid ABC transporter permease [Pseudodesulfovibrio sp.]|uniref:Polar amino acid ABC transporter, inner membrane subunit n=1 Tax=Pseudodesulfovibrio aespoeensis (strain ATCC 700646 / DSM 10631 / Aspo-2) TaxID=643562 RepID=E6VYK2_PSEA9|nr:MULTISPECIES: amino acid ABC transporter permease [Pseudodesulfovibrio]MBU4378117.1 amino acid ABC transporter permease [Pseudomonadota bacterium]MCG2731711.1 amino acid ABC transporter permease [Pseudodesulfovibrio aespoeensis]ADU62765.1 polar amino acid ABC transporter, inner membrane subunit [Pseudodesulfovibrio aespoeensis Aspo-2]MBU4474185.1 amino acid ABC transporter permease [Pseudomonadota bacterium]MBU4515701.1 amino acid ABC transporter permease [Pseudomonadota bacterium]